jgi:hypothetical protein
MKKKWVLIITIALLVALITTSTALAAPSQGQEPAKKTPQPDTTEQAKPGNGQGDKSNNGHRNDNANKPADDTDMTIDETGKPGKDKAVKDKNLKVVNYHGILMSLSATSLTVLLDDGSTVSFEITEKSEVKVPTFSQTSTTADLAMNMRVVVHAFKDKTTGIMTVRSINVVPGDPNGDSNLAGLVSDYQPGISITITDEAGVPTTYLLSESTQIILEDPTLTLAAGSIVTVIMPLKSDSETITAAAIVVSAPVVAPTMEPSAEPILEPTAAP